MAEKELSEIVAGHSSNIENIIAMISRLTEDVNTLSNRISSNSKTPTNTILSIIGIGLVVMMAFGGYFQAESRRQEVEIGALRSSQSNALYEAGRNEATRDRVLATENWQEVHDLRVRGLNARQDETIRWLEKRQQAIIEHSIKNEERMMWIEKAIISH